MTGTTGCLPSASGSVAEDLDQLLPRRLDRLLVGHVGHRAAGREVRQDDVLLRTGQDVGRLGHEVHAAEHDRLGVGLGEGGVGELERVAHEVGVLHDLVALVEVPEDDDALAELLLGRPDAGVQLVVAHLLVLDRQLAGPGDGLGDDVVLGAARSVAGNQVEDPRSLCELGVAARVRVGDDLLVDGSGRCGRHDRSSVGTARYSAGGRWLVPVRHVPVGSMELLPSI